MEAHLNLNDEQQNEFFRKTCQQVVRERKLVPGVMNDERGNDAGSEVSTDDYRDHAGNINS